MLKEHEQESYFTYAGEGESPVDHNVLFRPGIGVGGVDTFTPRTLIYDFKRAFGTLSKNNELYEDPVDAEGAPEVWFVKKHQTISHMTSEQANTVMKIQEPKLYYNAQTITD